ncbi:MAG: DUF4382 domain-containing protein [Steroidobacteraceae bacterium]|jgi:hypothetical protein
MCRQIRPAHLGLWALLTALTVLAGCSSRANVSMTGATDAQVQSAYVTVQAVWLNKSATALPTDTGWVGGQLATPLTLDLANITGTALTELLANQLLTPGTYNQLQLVLADPSMTLTTSAQAAGLSTNAEVTYLDSTGAAQTVPLELANPNGILVIPAVISITNGSLASYFAAPTSGLTSTDSTTATTTTTTSTTATDTTGSTTGDTATTSTAASTVTLAADIQAVRGLVLFNYGSAVGALLSPTLAAYNTTNAGGLSGNLDLTAVSSDVLTGDQGIVATAELLSADGSRYVGVKSVNVSAGGTFSIYPLPVASSGTTNYDLVIHGPSIQTIIITAIPVTSGTLDTTVSVQPDAITVAAASGYTVNTATGTAIAGGTTLNFYQSLPADSAPHLVESAQLNPFTRGLPMDLSLSSAPLSYGAYTGSDVALTLAAPQTGNGNFLLQTEAPWGGAASMSSAVAVSQNTAFTTTPISPPAPALPAGSNQGTLTGTVTFTTAGEYDSGFVVISHNGQVIDAVDLTTLASGSPTSVSFTDLLPSENADATYDVTVRTWNSADPTTTLVRTAATTQVDLRASTAQSLSIAVP